MCGLITQALKHRDNGRRRPVHTSPRESAPGVLNRSPLINHANPPPAGTTSGRERGDRLDEKSACDASERGPQGGERTFIATGVSGVGTQWASTTPKALRSPPRVRRVSSHYPALPSLAYRSSNNNNTGRDHRHHKRARGCRTESDTDVSSSYLAAAIGCPDIPAGMRAVENEGDDTGCAAVFDGHYRDLDGNTLKLESMGNVFRAGLDLGKTRFRGTSIV